MQIATKNKLGATVNTRNLLKPMHLCTKDTQKAKRTTPGYSHPGGPAIRTTVCMRPRSFASPARTARTTRTKRKRRRNEADLPVTGGRINRSNSPKPPICRRRRSGDHNLVHMVKLWQPIFLKHFPQKVVGRHQGCPIFWRYQLATLHIEKKRRAWTHQCSSCFYNRKMNMCENRKHCTDTAGRK